MSGSKSAPQNKWTKFMGTYIMQQLHNIWCQIQKDMPNKITKDVTITFHDHPKVCEEDKVIPWARC